MNHRKATVGIWGAVVLLGVAMLLTRYEDRRTAEASSIASDTHQAIALDWAHQRLWSDFLEAGQNRTSADGSFPRGMSEYREYLTSIGLSEFGDAVTFYIVHPESESSAADRMRVALGRKDEAILLDVTVEEEGRTLPAGTLRIRTDGNASLFCEIEQEPSPELWSFWPITAQPLLP